MTDPSSSDENTMNPILKSTGGTAPSSRLLRALFSSLHFRRWSLTRHLRSDNPADVNGELRGIATFQLLPGTSTSPGADISTGVGVGVGSSFKDLLYREEGEMPGTVPGMAGLRWSKKYIWRLNSGNNDVDVTNAGDDTNLESGKDSHTGISVWFVKQQHDEADYLFHEFEFDGEDASSTKSAVDTAPESENSENVFVAAPTPPPAAAATTTTSTTILTARGNHLCVKDMYRTAYAFRIHPETGEVLSWASRHVVKGPKKNQEIVNWYERES